MADAGAGKPERVRSDRRQANPEGEGTADEREELHELRERGHEAGIEGSSKMTADQLREALAKVGKGESLQDAKSEAKSDKPE